jgi:hypothetical protein
MQLLSHSARSSSVKVTKAKVTLFTILLPMRRQRPGKRRRLWWLNDLFEEGEQQPAGYHLRPEVCRYRNFKIVFTGPKLTVIGDLNMLK